MQRGQKPRAVLSQVLLNTGKETQRTGAQGGEKKKRRRRFRKDSPETDPRNKTGIDANGNKGVPAVRGVQDVKMKKATNMS